MKREDDQLRLATARENVVRGIENCGEAIKRNAKRIAGLYDAQTGSVTIYMEIQAGEGATEIHVENTLLNIIDD